MDRARTASASASSSRARACACSTQQPVQLRDVRQQAALAFVDPGCAGERQRLVHRRQGPLVVAQHPVRAANVVGGSRRVHLVSGRAVEGARAGERLQRRLGPADRGQQEARLAHEQRGAFVIPHPFGQGQAFLVVTQRGGHVAQTVVYVSEGLEDEHLAVLVLLSGAEALPRLPQQDDGVRVAVHGLQQAQVVEHDAFTVGPVALPRELRPQRVQPGARGRHGLGPLGLGARPSCLLGRVRSGFDAVVGRRRPALEVDAVTAVRLFG